MATKQEKIDYIKRIIANKKLINGCVIVRYSGIRDTFIKMDFESSGFIKYSVLSGLNQKLITEIVDLQEFESYVIEGSPVGIGEVLSYNERNFGGNIFFLQRDHILTKWENKCDYLDSQSSIFVNFFYKLLVKNENKKENKIQ